MPCDIFRYLGTFGSTVFPPLLFKKIALTRPKPVHAMIPQSEIIALEALICRLEETPPLTALDRFRKEKARLRRHDDPEMAMAHHRKHAARSVYQPRNKAHPVFGDTYYSLGFHVEQLGIAVSDWFAWAHFVAPDHAVRIKAILKRAKMSNALERFSAAYDRHLGDYFKPHIKREPSDDTKLTWLQGDVPRLNIFLRDIELIDGKPKNYRFEFSCCDCGGYVIEAPDDPDDDGPALCKACGQVFGTMAQVKALARYIAEKRMLELGLKV